jgi:phage terminase large subunit
LSVLGVELAEAFEPLLAKARYKGAYGGRGGAKSWFFADQIIAKCYAGPLRVVCIREVQHTLRESVRDLLRSRIETLGFAPYFDLLDDQIRGHNGSLIIFRGMQSFNAENIKSLEGFDIAWVEEAQTLSERSLRYLRPTIRKAGSEIWCSWNPRHDTDPVDRFFRGGEPHENAITVNVNWNDNPWFTAELRADKDRDYADDPEMAEHVWGGHYEIISAGSYFAKRIADAERDGRVGYYPHIPELPVFTAWDLGVDDYTAIWFAQIRHFDEPEPGEFVRRPRLRVIDYFEATGAGADEILKAALPEYSRDFQTRIEGFVDLGRDDPFVYARHFFPHDIGVREWGSGARTRVETVNSLGIPLSKIARGVAQNPEERINAAKMVLTMTEFHQSKRVMLGLSRLRRYSKKFNEILGVYVGPLHDENSHAADAFGELAMNLGMKPAEALEVAEIKLLPGQIRDPGIPYTDPTRIRL